MKLNKGLFRDVSPEEQPEGFHIGGKNMIFSNKYEALENEPGFNEIFSSELKQLIGVVKTPTEFVVFYILLNDSYNSEIGIYRNGAYITKLKANLNFNSSYPIIGTYYYNYLNQLVVVFTDNYNKPRILNIDDIPFEVAPNGYIINNDDIFKLNLFASFKHPEYSLIDVVEGSGDLLSGVYYLSIQYGLPDGSFGEFLGLSNPIYIYKDSSNLPFFLIGGCEDNISTAKAIKFSISYLDFRYTKFRVGIIHKTLSATNCYISNDYNITSANTSYLIPSFFGLSKVSLDTIIVPNLKFDKISAITNINNTLYISNTKINQEFKYQKYANNIKVKYVYTDKVSLNGYKGSFKDPVILFSKKTFQPGEVYAFYIRFIYKGGTRYTPAYHIPGRDIIGNEYSEGDEVAKLIYPAAKKFHIEDTCNIYGDMSYWENASEVYPDDYEYDGTVDYNGVVIEDGVDLRNKKVRHHKFPSSLFLNNNFNILDTVEPELLNILLTSPVVINENMVSSHKRIIFGNSTNNNNILQGRAFINNSNEAITIKFNCSVKGFATFYDVIPDPNYGTVYQPGTGVISFKAELNYQPLSLGFDDIIVTTPSYNGHIFNYSTSEPISITLQPFEILEFKIEAISDIPSSITQISPNEDSFILLEESEKFKLDGNLSGKVLGIRLENVELTQEVISLFEGFEILYAKRSSSNMTVISEGMLASNINRTTTLNTYNRYYDFNLLSTKNSVKPTHIYFNGYYNSNQYNNPESNITINNTVKKYAPVKQFKYLLNHTKDTIVNNLYRESSVYLDIDDSLIPISILSTHIRFSDINFVDCINQLYCTLYSFKEDVYLNFYNQELVSTNTIFPLHNYYRVKLYNGDSTISLTGFMRYYKYGYDIDYGNSSIFFVNYLLPVYSHLNPSLRYSGKELIDTFYPKISVDSIYSFGNPDDSPNSWLALIQSKYHINNLLEWTEFYSNNLLYTVSNSIKSAVIYNTNLKFTNYFPYRIYKSLKQLEGSKVQNWRIFKPLDFYDSVTNKGEIVALSSYGEDLLIHHRYSLFVARSISQIKIDESVVAALGSSQLFDIPPKELMHNGLGYVGCSSRFAIEKFKYGIFLVDRKSKKAFIYNGELSEISINGVELLFRNILDYRFELLNSYEYLFDDTSIVKFEDGNPVEYKYATFDEKYDVDNPFTDFGIFCVWDEENSRMLLTKKSRSITEYEEDNFTISYYPELKAWGFFHDYVPIYSFYNLNGLYHIDNTSKFYKANFKLRRNYYFDGYTDFYIDVVFNKYSNLEKLFQNIEWATSFKDGDYEYELLTFTDIELFSNDRHSLNIPIVINPNNSNFNTRRVSGIFRFNSIRDVLKYKMGNLLDLNKVDILTNIDENNYTNLWYEKNYFINNYIIVRLKFKYGEILNDRTNIHAKLFSVSSTFNVKNR